MRRWEPNRLQPSSTAGGVAGGKPLALAIHPPDWFEHLLGDKPEMYLNLMESVVYEAARLGEGVIIGHGSQMLLRDFGCAMHVLVTTHEESRIRNLMRQMDLSREAAQRLIHQSDNHKKGFFRYAFHTDWDDPTLQT